MSLKEIDRAFFLDKVRRGRLNLQQASRLLGLSYTQTKRLWSKYKAEGKRDLISKKRGKKSNRAVSDEKRKEIAIIISREY
jgi:transposase